ncbi:diguanylate cyclase/phosphodiesterase [Halalkalibacter wakoensis JCM 9140]|uniref:Diguanylate cyclase/phosphodiesterase n=1 Tax=Halalkalibacter wakoensis JCM 9140 TaxID=1236970 RepID=W4Q0Z6_9BACI|nr:GGDEF domain-containing phosphodiesterase [Halalkalibacter wakoensis]GAE25615.1 diguanylate cyclase/phosphodiesterase [Halalkalibacter wakoensis JCM 9140]
MSLEAELSHALKKLKDIESALNESSIVAITDEKGIIQFANDKFCEISKYSREELIGKTHRLINSGYHDKDFMKKLWETITKGEVWKGEFQNKAKDGALYWVDTTIVPFLNEEGVPYQFVSIRHDITRRKEIEKNMQYMAYFDPLTLLPNRNKLNKWVSEIDIGRKIDDQIAIVFLDLDRFKAINDQYGHTIGDLLLKQVGERLNSVLSEKDFITRQGGDEFVLILDQIESKQEVLSVIQNIINQLSFPFYIRNHKIEVSASIGVSVDYVRKSHKNYQEFIEGLMKEADHAMYKSKQQNGSSYSFSTPKQSLEMERYYLLQREMEQALDLNEFFLVYQPLVNLETNVTEGAEVLLRWNNAKFGFVPPTEFIPLLEETGQIISVGNWILRSACKQVQDWKDLGFPLKKLSVNVSPVQFRDQEFVRDVEAILNDTNLDPSCLELEITEGVLLNVEVSRKVLLQLKDLGVNISIDDFGTGYSSLSYLKHLPVDTIKIDKSFISELDSDGEVLVNTIINMGHNLHFTVIAEGIETEKQLTYLQQQNCQKGQGYIFSKPLKAQEFLRYLFRFEALTK